ncbi:hypothetical protein MJM43_31065, partial [Salmonella enterica subsp. enterica serovar Montevideo]|nr:hypothetical protein [Salmonella enterica subsp. enterica serovar Montevideo]
NETDVLMPAPITYAHRLVQRQAEVRKNGTLPWLRPDAKSQVTTFASESASTLAADTFADFIVMHRIRLGQPAKSVAGLERSLAN